MAKKPKKRHNYIAPDIVDYSALGYNPYVPSQETLDTLNSKYDVAMVAHRRRLQKWKERELAREELAKRLGVKFTPKLTPAEDILKMLP